MEKQLYGYWSNPDKNHIVAFEVMEECKNSGRAMVSWAMEEKAKASDTISSGYFRVKHPLCEQGRKLRMG